VSFVVPIGSLDFWSARLRSLGVAAERATRFDFDLLAFEDPDHIQLELVGHASDEGWVPWREGPIAVEHAIRRFHSVGLCEADAAPTAAFLEGTMGFREAGRAGNRIRYETGEGGPGAAVEVLVMPDAPPGEEAVGTVHHVAWRAPDDANEVAWRDALVADGRSVTPVINRKYFRSIYFREPGGVLFEIATDGPGFTVDEPPEALGMALQLPPQYEERRENLRFNLPEITVAPARRGAVEEVPMTSKGEGS
jgi:glyoxalase family protein